MFRSTPKKPSSPRSWHFDAVFPSHTKSNPTDLNILSIHNLINHPTVSDHLENMPEPRTPSTLEHSNGHPSPSTTGQLETASNSATPKRQKLVKDAALFIKGDPTLAVNFPPFECDEDSMHLSKHQKQELEDKHKEFEIFPSGCDKGGMICNYVRHIPYSSEKKRFFVNTGREAFDVFQYTFKVPNDPERREHLVMWDYNVGLVRITPFFKACQYSKTTPARALQLNDGLKELSYSITGGALAAQGYWMPYQCARAICLTFCHPIRWALTPIFGPSFTKDCLPQDHSDFGKFKIDPEITRMASLEAEGWRVAKRSASPESPAKLSNNKRPVPRSVPDPLLDSRKIKPLRPKVNRSKLMLQSESEYDSDTASEWESSGSGVVEPIPTSPKTRYQSSALGSAGRLGWTSINNPAEDKTTTIKPPPRCSPLTKKHPEEALWGAAGNDRTQVRNTRRKPLTPNAGLNTKKRRISNSTGRKDQVRKSRHQHAPISSSSESDDVDITPMPSAYKRARRDGPTRPRERSPSPVSVQTSPTPAVPTGRIGKYTPSEVRAARWLINLSFRDSQIAVVRKVMTGKKRSASVG